MSKKYFSYNINDSNELSYFRKYIDGLLINGNVYAHASSKTKIKILENKLNCIIDPMLYLFQSPIKLLVRKKEEQLTIKPSVIKLIKMADVNIVSKINKKIININNENQNQTFMNFFDISKKDIFKVANKFIKIQNDFIKLNSETKNNSIVLKTIQEKNNKKQQIIAPQFIPMSDEDIEINIKILENNDFDILPIYLNKTSLDKYKKYIEALKKYDGFEILIWVEKNIKENFYEILKEIKFNFKKSKISFRYGNYEELMLCKKEKIKIDKWINAFGYGEERNIFPIGGGLPVNKLYSPIQHKRINFEDFYDELNKHKINDEKIYLKKYCKCDICEKLLIINNGLDGLLSAFSEQSQEFEWKKTKKRIASTKAQRLTSRHFVHNKIFELEKYNEKIKKT